MWQPIETAPKNKTTVLVWNGDVHFAYYEQTKYSHFTGWFVPNNGDYIAGGYGDDYKMGGDDLPFPTHWMPLPKPPQDCPTCGELHNGEVPMNCQNGDGE